jgi:hypothetical protein
MGLFLSLVVNHAVGFNSLDLKSTAPLKVTQSQAGPSLLLTHSLSVLFMGSAVGVENGDTQQWQCYLPLDKPSRRSLFPI